MKTELHPVLTEFESADWCKCPECLPTGSDGFVYVLLAHQSDLRFPVYVGQTQRLVGRVGDYQFPGFAAPTDFKVGIAIRYLIDEKHCGIDFRYTKSNARRQRERFIIRELQFAGFHLLNTFASYQYRTAIEQDERDAIHRFCDMLLEQAAPCNQRGGG